MSEIGSILVESATRLLADLCSQDRLAAAETGTWPQEIWTAVRDMGLDRAAQAEDRGGAGDIDERDLCALLRAAGRHAAPLPLAETWLAERLLAAAGLPPLPDHHLPATVGPVVSGQRLRLQRKGAGWSLAGEAVRIPWARHAQSVVLLAESDRGTHTVVISNGTATTEGRNYAGEPRDTLMFDGVAVESANVGAPGAGYSFDDLIFDGALFRGAQMVGVLERILDLTVQYAKDRVQFGRPIGKFQAVQQQIAVLAGQVAAASAAGHGAADARAEGPARFEIACAKIRIGEAAGQVAAIAHQVHGAMGFTHEHTLHYSTRRLWSWRDEFGSKSEWSRWVGRTVTAIGGEGLWPFITDPNATATSIPLW